LLLPWHLDHRTPGGLDLGPGAGAELMRVYGQLRRQVAVAQDLQRLFLADRPGADQRLDRDLLIGGPLAQVGDVDDLIFDAPAVHFVPTQRSPGLLLVFTIADRTLGIGDS